jgi:hypothetical protein
MMYLVNEALLRLIKPLIALVLGALLYWLITGPLGEPGSVLLGLACWLSAAAFILLVENGII